VRFFFAPQMPCERQANEAGMTNPTLAQSSQRPLRRNKHACPTQACGA
jgi:hypothetical protein